MRIAYILNTLQVGGAERQVLALAEHMRARGHAVEILALREPAPAELRSPVKVVHLGATRNPVRAMRSYAAAAKELRAFRPHVVHSNQFHGNMLARALKLAMPSLKILSTIHNVHEGGAMRMMAYRITDPLAFRTVAVCNAALDRFARAGAVRRAKSSVIANAVDTVRFAPDPRRRDAIRAQMHAGECFIWLAVGRIAPAKDHVTLLRAFAALHAARPQSRLWIAGDGKPEYLRDLQNLAAGSSIAAQVQWLGLIADIAPLFDAADAFVLSSAWEGMPLALGEAMAMEMPFVATDVGGVRQMAGECGTLVPPRDVQALSAAMLRTMQASREELQHAGQAARARIVQHFSMESHVSAWEAAYAEAMRAQK